MSSQSNTTMELDEALMENSTERDVIVAACRVLLIAALALSVIAAWIHIAPHAGHSVVALLWFLLILGIPWMVARAPRNHTPWIPDAYRLFQVAGVITLVGISRVDTSLSLSAMLLMLQCYGVCRHSKSPWAHTALLISVALPWLVWFFIGSSEVLALGIGSLILAVIGLSWLHGRETHRAIKRRVRHGAIPPFDTQGLIQRSLYDVSRSWSILAIVIVVFFALSEASHWKQSTFPMSSNNSVQPWIPTFNKRDPLDSLISYPRDLEGHSGLSRKDPSLNDSMMTVRIKEKTTKHFVGGDPFLWRASTINRIENGVPRGAKDKPALLRGSSGEWIDVGESASSEDLIVLEITSANLRDSESGETIVAAGSNPSAVYIDLEGWSGTLLRRDDGTLSIPDRIKRPLHYGVAYSGRSWRLLSPNGRSPIRALARSRAHSLDRDDFQLPSSAEWVGLFRQREKALALAKGAETDIERVRMIVFDLRENYLYDRESAFSGSVTSVDDLEETGKGLCSHFALTALIRLRCLSIPCRIATGYAVDQWDSETEQYWVTRADQHAWIEVPFEGIGWISFDPTSAADSSDEIPDSPMRIPDPRVAQTDSTPLSHLSLPTILALAIGLITLAWCTRRIVRPNIASSKFVRDTPKSVFGPLLKVLAERGHAYKPWQTPMEFAEELNEAKDPELKSLTSWISRLYSLRFGEEPWSPTDRVEFEVYVNRLSKRE